MRGFFQRFRENNDQGKELWTWSSGFETPNWEASLWLYLDKWGLGIETELDPGSAFFTSQRRRFFAIQIGPLAFVVMRTSDVKAAIA